MHNIYTMIKPDNTQWIFSFLLDCFVPAELQTDSEVKQIISIERSDEVEITSLKLKNFSELVVDLHELLTNNFRFICLLRICAPHSLSCHCSQRNAYSVVKTIASAD